MPCATQTSEKLLTCALLDVVLTTKLLKAIFKILHIKKAFYRGYAETLGHTALSSPSHAFKVEFYENVL